MRHTSRWVPGTVRLIGLCAVAALVVANLVRGEAKIARRIVHALGVLLGPPFLPGTQVRALRNGDEISPPMLAAIRAAQVSITFETDIYSSGDIGRAFADALADMLQADVQTRHFRPPHGSHLGRLTNRIHRKLRLNDEATRNVFDKAFAQAQTAIFETDLTLSRQVSHAEWLAHPLQERVAEGLASLPDTQL